MRDGKDVRVLSMYLSACYIFETPNRCERNLVWVLYVESCELNTTLATRFSLHVQTQFEAQICTHKIFITAVFL